MTKRKIFGIILKKKRQRRKKNMIIVDIENVAIEYIYCPILYL
jgi:hypothetical protein